MTHGSPLKRQQPQRPGWGGLACIASSLSRPLGFAVLFAACCVSTAVSPVEAGSDEIVQRGRYLATTILACGNCHTPKDEFGHPRADLALAGGGLAFDTPQFAGTAPNITPDRETGIGEWSDEDIKRAITQGTRPAHGRLPGVPLAAIMWVNFYKALTPRDLDAVVAYLRSLPPIRHDVPLPDYKSASVRDPYPEAERGFSEGELADPARRGAYLVTVGHCLECHTPVVGGRTDYQGSLAKGGKTFGPALVKGFPETWRGSVAPNITSHPVSGIGGWSDDEIKRAITRGVSRDGTPLGPPMAFAWYAGLTESDLNAAVAYLRTLPPRP